MTKNCWRAAICRRCQSVYQRLANMYIMLQHCTSGTLQSRQSRDSRHLQQARHRLPRCWHRQSIAGTRRQSGCFKVFHELHKPLFRRVVFLQAVSKRVVLQLIGQTLAQGFTSTVHQNTYIQTSQHQTRIQPTGVVQPTTIDCLFTYYTYRAFSDSCK